MDFIKGLFIGFMLGLLVAIYINLSNIEANAQTTLTATVVPNLCNANLDVIHACCESVK